MKVLCKNILSCNADREDMGKKTDSLTVGKEYLVLGVFLVRKSIILYHIEPDFGGLAMFDADQFEVVSSYIPSNWEAIVKSNQDDSYYFKLSPRNWNEAEFSFYEEICEVSWPLSEWRQYDKVPEVVSLYFQERDLIYREEEEHEKRNSSGNR